jgi:hypothetical protein
MSNQRRTQIAATAQSLYEKNQISLRHHMSYMFSKSHQIALERYLYIR